MTGMFVHESSRVENTVGDSGSKIYQACDIQRCKLAKEATIGDFSRLADCCLGERAAIQRNAMMYGVRIGRYSYTGKNFTAWHCSIGDFCSISWNVSIGGANHDYSRTTTHSFLYSSDFGLLPEGEDAGYDRFASPCIVEHDVWIAANACICRGVTVHTGAVVAAGAVVTHDVEPYTIVAGVPAKPIKKRFDDETIRLLLESRWWEFPQECIRENYALFRDQANIEIATKLLDIRKRIDDNTYGK